MKRLGLKYVLLAVLAIAAVAVAGFALVRVPANIAEATRPAPVVTPTTVETGDPAVMLGAVKGLLAGADPITISVLGDSTGNATGEWVDLWAKDLTANATVTLHQWDDKNNTWIPEPVVYGDAERQITIWNGSMPGSTYAYALGNFDAIQPEKPSFVIHNFGHNKAPQRADAGAMDLLAAVDAKWGPTSAVIVLQNPSRGARELTSADSVHVLRGWADRTGHPVVDVDAAFRTAGPIEGLLADDVHPNAAGQRIWADTIKATLG